MDNKTDTLAGKLLLAMPGMGDPRFYKAVILVCAHDENGAMGLVINHVLPGVDFRTLLKQLNLPVDQAGAHRLDIPVIGGGPVENTRGFIIHSADYTHPDTVRINAAIGVTGTVDALRAVADGSGPQDMLFALGYSGWGAGQLDREMQDNAWLVFDCDADAIFHVPAAEKWDHIIRRVGINPSMLSGNAGHA